MIPCTARSVYSELAWEDLFDTPSLRAEWQWIDPRGQSSWEMLPREGVLVVRSPAASGASQAATTAPRLLRPVAGDFAAETALIGAAERECHTAGLLLLASAEEYLFFGKGDPAVYEVRLEVCRHGQRQTIGRGWLPGPDLYLRLERLGDRVTTLCSQDGRQWQSCGETSFASAGDLRIGFYVACPTPLLPGSVARFKGFRYFLPESV